MKLSGDVIQFPEKDLLADVESLRAERKWMDHMMTRGAKVGIEGPADEPTVIGTIITPLVDLHGGGLDRMVEVETMVLSGPRGRISKREWFSALRLAPIYKPGKVVKFPRR